jgi:hypothetical protein
MEIRGKVHEIGATQQVAESFKKRDLIVAYADNPQFVEYIRFEATQDRVNIFDNLQVGEDVEVSFNLRGRPWTNKDGVTTYFNSLVAWRVTKLILLHPRDYLLLTYRRQMRTTICRSKR